MKPNLLGVPLSSPADYRFAWLVAFAIALASAPFVVAFKHSAPWLIAVTIVLGFCIILFAEVRTALGSSAEEWLTTMPSGARDLVSYDRLIALEVSPKPKVPKGQLSLFPGFNEPVPHKAIKYLRDSQGHEVPVVSGERFSALLISYLLEHTDEVTEKSLRAGLARFAHLAESRQSDLKIFVHDKGIREAIKSDFRGNLMTLVTRGGEKVIKDLVKATKKPDEADQERADAFRLAAQ
jgi:hypothetical protein